MKKNNEPTRRCGNARGLARKRAALEIKEAFERSILCARRRAFQAAMPSWSSCGPAVRDFVVGGRLGGAAATGHPPQGRLQFENGMAICVGNIDVEDDCFDVAFCVVVNNVARGAQGRGDAQRRVLGLPGNRKTRAKRFAAEKRRVTDAPTPRRVRVFV